MRKFVLYSLILLLLSHTMSQVVIVTNFIYNQDFIAQNLCENIEKPVLKCNGKCQLAKELEQNEEKQPSQTIPKIDTSFFIVGDHTIELRESFVLYLELNNTLPSEENLLNGVQNSIFHPPCC